MVKVLIISDNVNLVTTLKNIVSRSENDYHDVCIDYRYSKKNGDPSSLIKIGMKSIDLKNQKVIEKIIGDYNLVISAHCKQIFPAKLVNSIRCINIHPGLNPHNRGWYPQDFSIINKKPIGCTIHLMNEDIDDGEIIYQKEVEQYPWDTSLSLYERVQSAEIFLLENYLLDIIFGRYSHLKKADKGNYNGIKNFNLLRKIDLASIGTFQEHIDLLRALSHGDFKNAYFEMKDGRKVYLKLSINLEDNNNES